MITLYGSDHGYGHATRMSALAEHLVLTGHEVTLVLGRAESQIGAALARLNHPNEAHDTRVRTFRASLDVGLIQSKDSFSQDYEASRVAILDWLDRWEEIVEQEVERLSELRPSIVVVDVPAPACEAASRLHIPSVLVSNFTWLDNYGRRFGEGVYKKLFHAYGKVRVGLRLSPGGMALEGVSRVVDVKGVLARKARRSRNDVRRELGVKDSDLLVNFGFGRGFDPNLIGELAKKARDSGAVLLMPSDSAIEGAVLFPENTLDSQDYLACSDLLIGKAGYSTCAEAALHGVPMVLFPLPDNHESKTISRDIEALNYGIVLPDEQALTYELSNLPRLCEMAQARRRHAGKVECAAPYIARHLV